MNRSDPEAVDDPMIGTPSDNLQPAGSTSALSITPQPAAGSSRRVSPRVNRKLTKSKKPRITKKQKRPCGKKVAGDWRKPEKFETREQPWSFTGNFNMEMKSPLQFFKMFIDDDLLDQFVVQSNNYAHEKDATVLNLTRSELEVYFGILLQMAIIQMPQYTIYWNTETRFPVVADAMSRNRFQQIKKYLHIVDNSTFDPANPDKLFKIRPFVEALRANLLKLVPEEKNSIDEQVIPFKGRTPILQYIKNKPHKWGYKVFTRAGLSGIVYDFRVYEGASTKVTNHGLGISGNIVLELVETLPQNQNFKLFFDNWFSSVPLVEALTEKGFQCIGTIRENRTLGCPIKSEKELSKTGRGSNDFAVDANSGAMVVG